MGCATKRKVARHKLESLEPYQNEKQFMQVGWMVYTEFHFGLTKFEHPDGAILQEDANTGIKLSNYKIGGQK